MRVTYRENNTGRAQVVCVDGEVPVDADPVLPAATVATLDSCIVIQLKSITKYYPLPYITNLSSRYSTLIIALNITT